MRRRIRGSGQETKKLWFDVYHPECRDEYGNKLSQGRVNMSFEIVPEDLLEGFANAEGRADPNFFPSLPDPSGRFTFNLFDPLGMLKEILGPSLYYKLWGVFWCLFASYCFLLIGNALVAQVIASIIGIAAVSTVE